MCRMVLREFNIPLCYEKLPRPKKNNFQNFFKKFSIFNFRFWQNLNAPLFPQYSHDHQKIFSRILVGNFTISQFLMSVFLISTVRLILCDLFRGLSGRVLIVCADLFRIAGMLHKFQIYRCAGLGVLIFRHAPAIESGRTSPRVFLADLSGRVCRISERTN